MRRVGQGDKVWREVGVGSGDVAALLNCAERPEEQNVLALWASIVRKRDLRSLPKVKKVTLEQGSEAWLKWRNYGLGGSEVGCVMGANSYKGSQALDVWGRKLPADHPDAVPEVKDNAAMRQGREREPEARDLYEKLYGWKSSPLCVIHDDHTHVRCSLDGLSEDEKVSLEIKCSFRPKNHLTYLAISRIDDPFERQTAFAVNFPSYRYQVLYQLLITGAPVTHFVGFYKEMDSPADRLAVFELYPEPAEMQRLLERVNEFWRYVEARVAPPPEWLRPVSRLPECDDLLVPKGLHGG